VNAVPRRRRPTAVGAYIFAGGFTLGVREYFDVLCHLEDGPYGIATVRHNLPELPIYIEEPSWPLKDLIERNIDLIW